MESGISRKERKRRLANLADLSFNDASPDATPNEMFPHGILAREPRDPVFDREIAIVAATGVEQGLEHAIVLALGEREDAAAILFGGDAPIIRDFNGKIKFALIMNIIGPNTADDIQVVRKIRNVFAHSRLIIDFDREEVSSACDLISLPEREPMTMEGIEVRDARERYIQSCFRLQLYLLTFKPGRETYMSSLRA